LIGPTDLVALVAFDGRVYRNQAVTREHIGRRQPAPHALGAALQHWLLRRRNLWMDIRGRQIHGIATARDLGSSKAWEIDTLIDASDKADGALQTLLEQALEAAVEHGVSHVLLRLQQDSPALEVAARAGFAPVMAERMWTGDGSSERRSPEAGIEVRRADKADRLAQFQLYNRALPATCRAAIAMTLEEWEATRERHWFGRGGREYMAFEGARPVAALRMAKTDEAVQLELTADAGGGERGANELLGVAARSREARLPFVALVPEPATPVQSALAAFGLQPSTEYVLMCRRTRRTQRDEGKVRKRVPIPSGG
jgi:hypothetical protein